jgi:hypothetical protein
MRIRAAALAGALILAWAGSALAIDLSGAAKALAPAAGVPAGGSGVADGLLGKVNDLKGSYSGATKNMTEGRAKILTAFGMKDEAAKVRAGAAKVTSGNVTPADVEAATATAGSADNAIRTAIAQKKKLGKDGKKQFTAGVKDLAAGLKQEAAVAVSAKSLGSDVEVASSGAGLMDVPKLAAAGEVLGSLGVQVPKSLVSTRDTLSSCADFGKAAGLSLPKGVGEAIAASKQVAP